MNRHQFKTLFLILSSLGVISCASHRKAIDTEEPPLLANDMTAPVSGCGQQIIAGYTYCRQTENAPTTGVLSFYAPITKCGKESCSHGTLYGPDGQPVLGLAFKGTTRQDVSWMTILKSQTFKTGDRGIYLWCLEIEYYGSNDEIKSSKICSEIRLRVVSQNYAPLHQVEHHKNFIWQWCENNQIIKMTSTGRTFVGERCD